MHFHCFLRFGIPLAATSPIQTQAVLVLTLASPLTLPYIGYTNIIPFDRDSLFTSDHFHGWAASKGIPLEPSTAYHQQTDGRIEIVNTQVVTIVRACELKGDQCVKNLTGIQLKLKSRYDSSRGSSPVYALYAFTPRFGQAQMPYPPNEILAERDRHA